MNFLERRLIFFFAVVLVSIPSAGKGENSFWNFPPLPEPQDYGDILMDRSSSIAGEKPVFFSHWSHRIKHSCRVCHFELDFAFTNGQTEITEEDNRNGLFCGACHDGKTVFGHTEENCARCHTGKIISQEQEFKEFSKQLKEAPYGNKLDWVDAVESGAINPVYSIFNKDEKPLGYDQKLELKANWAMVPPAFFDHRIHTRWLDCANCHPDIFNIQKKTTKHFSMDYILENKFCGVCHLRIAFPLDDCKGCHPDYKMR